MTRAAEGMNLSTAAMSRTLSRIRDAVGDPILVRAGRQLVPTPRALELRSRVHALADEARFSARVETRAASPFAGSNFRHPNQRQPCSCVCRATDRAGAATSAECPLTVSPSHRPQRCALREGAIDLEIANVKEMGPEISYSFYFRITSSGQCDPAILFQNPE